MKITKDAAIVILNVMAKKNLDTNKTYFFIRNVPGANSVGLGFDTSSYDPETGRYGKVFNMHGLLVSADPEIDISDIMIDYGEVAGKKGIILLPKENR